MPAAPLNRGAGGNPRVTVADSRDMVAYVRYQNVAPFCGRMNVRSVIRCVGFCLYLLTVPEVIAHAYAPTLVCHSEVVIIVVVCEPIPRPVATERSMTRLFRSLPTMGAMLDIAGGVYTVAGAAL